MIAAVWMNEALQSENLEQLKKRDLASQEAATRLKPCRNHETPPTMASGALTDLFFEVPLSLDPSTTLAYFQWLENFGIPKRRFA